MTLNRGREWLAVILLVLLLADLVILLDILLLRQIVGFIFLTFVPGLLILQVLKLDKIGFTEKVVLSVGISISFLMIFGLLINNLSLGIGYETPLATIPLLVSFNIIIIALAIIGYRVNKDTILSLPNLNLNTSEKAFLIVPIMFPVLCIFGMHVMNTTDNNLILMLLYLLIPAYIIFVCFFNHKFPKRLYPVVIFSISVSLLLLYMLRFPHIHGHDVHSEYCLFRMTLNNLHWSIEGSSLLNACLSISLLPAIYQSVMSINAQENLFKGVCVLICSFSPLAIYIMSKRYIDESYAFLASFFFISQSAFLTAARNPRTDIAIFFAALAVMVFFNDKIDPLKRRILFIIFLLSVVVSHYSTAYLFFFIILSTWFAGEIFAKKLSFDKKITLTVVLIFFAFIFFWYSQITAVPFNAGVRYFESTFLSLNNFFVEELREPVYKQLVGQGLQHGIVSRIHFFVTWGSFILIGIGVLSMLIRYKEMVHIPNINVKKLDFLKTKFEVEFLTMALACAGILALTVALPYVSTGYGTDRLYSLVIIILSVCFVIGGMTLSHFLSKERTCAKKVYKNIFSQGFCEAKKLFGKAFLSKKRFVLKEKQKSLIRNFSFIKKQKGGRKDEIWKGEKNASNVRAYLIILLILIPYFLMVTGVTHQIAGIPASIILNSGGREYEKEYLHDQECSSAKWLKNYAEKNGVLYTDRFGFHKLVSQGAFSPRSVDSTTFFKRKKIRGYIYLSYNNVVNDKFVAKRPVSNRTVFNMSDYADVFVGKNEIYDNGGSEIYR
ncbi:hypothetical protein C5S29_14270 [ANME-1 cluster archaeon GoMg3.2]|nr:hypothetical protein [ANME-1 cluster archaeon GoMg3.2]